jgi:hypothetical protein
MTNMLTVIVVDSSMDSLMVILLEGLTVKKTDKLTTLSTASKVLGVPRSTLVYHLMSGHIRRYEYGPVTLIDVDQADEALTFAGYWDRQHRAERLAVV